MTTQSHFCQLDRSAGRLHFHPPCIDLAENFGQRFRVQYEESYFAQYGPHARVEIAG